MTTKVYGESDDLVSLEGEISGEVDGYDAGFENCKRGVLLVFSDGTVLEVKYGDSLGSGIWRIDVRREGSLLVSHDKCTDENADLPSDVVLFADGLKWALRANPDEWGTVV